MTTIDLSPLFRTRTIGIDQALNQLQSALSLDSSGFPACDVLRLDEDGLRIRLAVPGYGDRELIVELHDRTLWVRGERGADPDHNRYLYRSIGSQGFQRAFRLPEHARVVGAQLENGLLNIDLIRELPEALRPRRIEISTTKGDEVRLQDATKAA